MPAQSRHHGMQLCSDHDWRRYENLIPQFAENYQPSLIESLQMALKYHQTQLNECVRNVQATMKLLAPNRVRELSRALKQSESSLRESLEETLAEDQAKLAHHLDFVISLQDNISTCKASVPKQQNSELEVTVLFEPTRQLYKLEAPVEERSDNVSTFWNQLEVIDQWIKKAHIQKRFDDVRQKEDETQERIDAILRLNAQGKSFKRREEKQAEMPKLTHAQKRRMAFSRPWRKESQTQTQQVTPAEVRRQAVGRSK
jgi:hypothetical protein